MRKLKLDIDHLEVQSFETAGTPEARGTVRGHISYNCNTQFAGCSNNTCPGGGHTCDAYSCPAESCDGCGTNRCGSEGTSEIMIDGICV
jgi:hypothetical protein